MSFSDFLLTEFPFIFVFTGQQHGPEMLQYNVRERLEMRYLPSSIRFAKVTISECDPTMEVMKFVSLVFY